MPAKHATIVLITAAFLTLTTSANAASFNCTKAKTPDEKAICANRSLSELDVKMAALFGVRMKLPMLMGSRGAAQDEQREFLVNRGICGADAACIGAAYQQRIDELTGTIDAALEDYCVKLGICG
jgi:uncharacterized protein